MTVSLICPEKMNKFLQKISKIDVIVNNAVRLFDLYKKTKLHFVNFRYEAAENPTLTKEVLLDYNKHRKFDVSKTLCFAPKKSMLFSFDGNVYVCCENKQYSIGNIQTESLHDIWFGEKRQFIDKKINQDYNLAYGCSSCSRKIQQGNHSLALSQTFDIYTRNSSDFPARLDFEIHNTCNLECVMCGGIYSSSIQANRYQQPAIPMKYGGDFVQQLEEFLPHVRYINLLGGEPTLIKIYYDIMERVIAVNPSCIIHLQTNASTLNKKFRDILTRGNFQIGISIDSLTESSAERIRKNLHFETFMENVSYYLSLYKKDKIKLTINTCPMPDNWQEIIPIIEFCNTHQLPIFFCIVNAPHYNTFLSQSPGFIDKVYLSLKSAANTLPRKSYYEKNNHEKLTDFLHQLISWKKIVIKNEQYTQQLIQKQIPELYSIYQEKLLHFMDISDKESIIRELLDYTFAAFKSLEIPVQKELLTVLINAVNSPIVPSSREEQIKWGKEYINTLIFSYEQSRNIR